MLVLQAKLEIELTPPRNSAIESTVVYKNWLHNLMVSVFYKNYYTILVSVDLKLMSMVFSGYSGFLPPQNRLTQHLVS